MGRLRRVKEDRLVTKHVLKMSAEERGVLSDVAKGTRGRRTVAQWKAVRANALLECDQGEHGPARSDAEIAAALGVTERSLQNWRRKAVLEGPEAALERSPRAVRPRKVDGRLEAHITKLACSAPPEGRSRWTLQLLADKVVELELVDSLSHETVRRTLKKTG